MKNPSQGFRFKYKVKGLAATYSPDKVPSAQEGLTAVFGMGTGVALPL